MSTENKQPLRTIGPQMARVLAALQDAAQTTFTLRDVQRFTGLTTAAASNLLKKAVRRALISRIKRGVFMIVPAEMGTSGDYAGNPYVIANRLAGDAPHFISFASAMEIHRMVTQPQFVIFTSSTKRIPNRKVQGIEFRFVLIKPHAFFGSAKHWATKQDFVLVSDLERTVIDGLHRPEYCGGIADVAKGLWMRRQDMKASKLIEYALQLKVGAVIRRLGFLLELYRLAPEGDLERLHHDLTATYVPLDPVAPKSGKHLARWRLLVNVSRDELEAVRAA